jgi:N-acetylglucosamine-6-phosphate deacetylase
VPGVDSVGYQLSTIWSKLKAPIVGISDTYQHYIVRLFKYLSTNPARILGIGDIRGQIAEGYLADLVIWKPEDLCP